jgi:ERCC4-type nuclease
MVFKIIIDSREQKLISNFPENETTTASLFLGDVAITDDDDNVILIFERKTLSDLKASVFDGRYKEQKKRLTENFSNRQIMYLIEGFQKFDKLDEILLSSLIHSIFRDNINVLFTKDPADTATAIKAIHKRVCKNPSYFIDEEQKRTCYSNPILMKHKNDQDVQINMLCQIPGISTATANALIKEFGSMNCLMNVMNDSSEYIDDFKVNDRKINKNAVSNLKKHLLATYI